MAKTHQLLDRELVLFADAAVGAIAERQPAREVDVVIVVDNSGDMAEEQARLVAQLPRLVATFATRQDDANFYLESMRFAVVSIVGARPWLSCIPPRDLTPGRVTMSTPYRYNTSFCDASTLPAHVSLVCDAATETCQISCVDDADCAQFGPDPYFCEGSGDGRNDCLTLCCGC